MNHIQNLILDMDGVLWHGDTPMPGLAEFFGRLRQLNIDFVLATNNAAKTPGQYAAKLARFGVEVPESAILTSSEATAEFLRGEYDAGTAVFVVGGTGLQEAVEKRGFRRLSVEDVLAGETAAVVTVGFYQEAAFPDFAAGAICIHKGARFVGTNPDPTFPSEYGPLPGAGSFLALIETATGVAPTIIGKPGPLIFQDAMRRLGGTPENTAMVGDRLSTDIAGGKAAGIPTILLLSGITSRADLADSDIQPDYIFTDITELVNAFSHE
jgi:4-nitrophenyl phosphatase